MENLCILYVTFYTQVYPSNMAAVKQCKEFWQKPGIN